MIFLNFTHYFDHVLCTKVARQFQFTTPFGECYDFRDILSTREIYNLAKKNKKQKTKNKNKKTNNKTKTKTKTKQKQTRFTVSLTTLLNSLASSIADAAILCYYFFFSSWETAIKKVVRGKYSSLFPLIWSLLFLNR